MRARSVVCGIVMFGLVAGLSAGPAYPAERDDLSVVDQPTGRVEIAERLDAIVESIPSIPAETKLRRSLAHATFCLPQNVLGILCLRGQSFILRVLRSRAARSSA